MAYRFASAAWPTCKSTTKSAGGHDSPAAAKRCSA
jgi:hypothetical protein